MWERHSDIDITFTSEFGECLLRFTSEANSLRLPPKHAKVWSTQNCNCNCVRVGKLVCRVNGRTPNAGVWVQGVEEDICTSVEVTGACRIVRTDGLHYLYSITYNHGYQLRTRLNWAGSVARYSVETAFKISRSQESYNSVNAVHLLLKPKLSPNSSVKPVILQFETVVTPPDEFPGQNLPMCSDRSHD
jgi:hypothetical protein